MNQNQTNHPKGVGATIWRAAMACLRKMTAKTAVSLLNKGSARAVVLFFASMPAAAMLLGASLGLMIGSDGVFAMLFDQELKREIRSPSDIWMAIAMASVAGIALALVRFGSGRLQTPFHERKMRFSMTRYYSVVWASGAMEIIQGEKTWSLQCARACLAIIPEAIAFTLEWMGLAALAPLALIAALLAAPVWILAFLAISAKRKWASRMS